MFSLFVLFMILTINHVLLNNIVVLFCILFSLPKVCDCRVEL